MNDIKFTATKEGKIRHLKAFVNEKEIAKACYAINEKDCWLYNIEVLPEMRGLHIGSILLDYMESDCISSHISTIEGKFYPYNEDGAAVRAFYEKNGYSIFWDDYNQIIFKYLNKTNIAQKPNQPAFITTIKE